MRDLKKYDRFLNVKRKLNGAIIIERKSPFNARRNFEVLKIKNQYTGSFAWVLKRISSMDNQRFDLIGKTMANNKAIYNRKNDDRVTREIASFWDAGGESIIV